MRSFKILLTTACLSLVIYSSSLFATVVTVNGIPSTRNVTSAQSANVRVVWNLTLAAATSGQLPRVRSLSGSLTGANCSVTAANVSYTVNVPISRSLTLPAVGTVTVIETLHIPVSFLYQLRKFGCTSFNYSRAFDDDGGAGTVGQIAAPGIAITSSLGSGFIINLVSIRFDDGSPKRLVKHNGKLGVYARITYSGAGLLKGTWEIAEPSSTAGQPVFRSLREEYAFQPGVGQNVLKGPRLPTQQRGIYYVRFNIKTPQVGFSPPTIRYYVYGTGEKPDFGIMPISILGPGNNSLLNNETLFEWKPINGARAVQVEIYSSSKNPIVAQLPDLGAPEESSGDLIKGVLVAGKVVHGSKSSMRLDANSLAKLRPGQWYVYRLIAFNEKGKIIAVSRPHRILAQSN
jgi:hypothetical protein